MKIIVPGKIKSKQRPRVMGKFSYTPKETVNYENWIKSCYIEQIGLYTKILEGYLKVVIKCFFSVPKSYSKKRTKNCYDGIERPAKKPDVDNVGKLVLDSLNKIAYDDDKQVVELMITKEYDFEERLEIDIIEIER